MRAGMNCCTDSWMKTPYGGRMSVNEQTMILGDASDARCTI